MIKKIINICLLTCFGFLLSFQQSSFKSNQLKFKRVKTAYDKKWEGLQALLQTKSIDKNNFDIHLRVFKLEKMLELWVKNQKEGSYKLLKSFPVCASSGTLGPKRKQGDYQVPEGFYDIPMFQPYSDYHLALKVGYPNKSDKLKTTAKDPGGDIMIHGNCVTIGCIPLQDEPIEELYILCVEAKNRNRPLNVDIYPCKFTETNMGLLAKKGDEPTKQFWESLKKAYDYFELNHSLPKITVDNKGNYVIN